MAEFHFLFHAAQTILHVDDVLLGGDQLLVDGMVAVDILILGKIPDIFIFGEYHIAGCQGKARA